VAQRQATRGRLALEDGAVFPGLPFGAPKPASGEVVFTTGMVYPETLTDPSDRGQIPIFIYSSLGKYGVPALRVPDTLSDAGPGSGSAHPPRPWESGRIRAAGVTCANYSAEYSHQSAGASPGDCAVDRQELADPLRGVVAPQPLHQDVLDLDGHEGLVPRRHHDLGLGLQFQGVLELLLGDDPLAQHELAEVLAGVVAGGADDRPVLEANPPLEGVAPQPEGPTLSPNPAHCRRPARDTVQVAGEACLEHRSSGAVLVGNHRNEA